jgi:hypothetical protein
MASRKLSGAELAKQLAGLATPNAGAGVEGEPGDLTKVPEVEIHPSSPAEAPASLAIMEVHTRPPQVGKPKTAGYAKARGGRPAKAGVDGMPVNVRLSQADHLALARLAGKLVVPGRPMPTVQDVVRGIIRGALKEPELATRFCRQQDN